MNIIIDEVTHKELQKYVIETIEFGSTMKGTSTVNSDHDYLHIIYPSSTWQKSPVNTNHLLQYKDDGADHIYCDPVNFVKCLLDGDSTIFHEMLRYNVLNDTCISFLNKYKFEHYKTLRAYLGIARRDLKEVSKLFNNNEVKSRKKLNFAIESHNYVCEVLNATQRQYTLPMINTIHDLRVVLSSVQKSLDILRNDINLKLQSGTISRTISKEELHDIQSELNAFNVAFYSSGLSFFYDSHILGN
ncbi:hypothetical protein NVP2275O_261 [Vibrio phage 2.275.O._10N.286.54.E11]|nr:hypothetical protein NVP2275O_261 [Vibrio phage 2.275.O._10N.286.54.E11]